MLIAILMSVFSCIIMYELFIECFLMFINCLSWIILFLLWVTNTTLIWLIFFPKKEILQTNSTMYASFKILAFASCLAYVCSALISLCQFALAQTGFFLTILFHWVFRCLSSVQIYYNISLLKLFNLKSKPHLTSSK